MLRLCSVGGGLLLCNGVGAPSLLTDPKGGKLFSSHLTFGSLLGLRSIEIDKTRTNE